MAVVSTLFMVTRLAAVHALLYLVISLLATSVMFLTLGAPFLAALELVVYAGAIMVLFVFVVMMLNLGPRQSRDLLLWAPGTWIGAGILALVLLGELVYVIASGNTMLSPDKAVGPKDVSITLFGPYVLGVELASMLLLAGLVGAYHIGRREPPDEERPGVT